MVPKLDADTVLQLLLLESVIPTRTLRNLGECYEGRRALPRDKCIEKIEREGRVDSIIKSLSNNADLETIAAKRTKIGFVFPKYGTDNVLNLWNSLLENIPKRPPLSVSMNGDSLLIRIERGDITKILDCGRVGIGIYSNGVMYASYGGSTVWLVPLSEEIKWGSRLWIPFLTFYSGRMMYFGISMKYALDLASSTIEVSRYSPLGLVLVGPNPEMNALEVRVHGVQQIIRRTDKIALAIKSIPNIRDPHKSKALNGYDIIERQGLANVLAYSIYASAMNNAKYRSSVTMIILRGFRFKVIAYGDSPVSYTHLTLPTN